jgi:hypothetical protein
MEERSKNFYIGRSVIAKHAQLNIYTAANLNDYRKSISKRQITYHIKIFVWPEAG